MRIKTIYDNKHNLKNLQVNKQFNGASMREIEFRENVDNRKHNDFSEVRATLYVPAFDTRRISTIGDPTGSSI